MQLTVTPVYAAIFAVMILLMTYRVVQYRRSEKIVLVDGDNAQLRRTMGDHSHALDNIPVSLQLMLLELKGFYLVHIHLLGMGTPLSRLKYIWPVTSYCTLIWKVSEYSD